MKNIKTFSLALAMLFFIAAFGQKKVTSTGRELTKISGIVSEKGLPLPGVSVVVIETTRGTQTDFDGCYAIEAAVGETLEFSYLGFISQKIKVGNSTTLNIQLIEDSTSLEEVVVVDYSTVKNMRLPDPSLK